MESRFPLTTTGKIATTPVKIIIDHEKYDSVLVFSIINFWIVGK